MIITVSRQLRFNTLKVGKDKGMNKKLPDKDKLGIPMDKKVTWADNAYYYDEDKRPGKHPYHEMGLLLYTRAECDVGSSSFITKARQRVLDLCAAPGGKSTQLSTI